MQLQSRSQRPRFFWSAPRKLTWEKSECEPAWVTAATFSTRVEKPLLNLNAGAFSNRNQDFWFRFLISIRASRVWSPWRKTRGIWGRDRCSYYFGVTQFSMKSVVWYRRRTLHLRAHLTEFPCYVKRDREGQNLLVWHSMYKKHNKIIKHEDIPVDH